MSKLIKESKLPSCEVTLNMLFQIESFLLSDIFQILNINEKYYEVNLSISVADNFGHETFKSSKLLPDIFTNSTSRISLNYYLRLSRGNIYNIIRESNKKEDIDISEEVDNIYNDCESKLYYLSIDISLSNDHTSESLRITYEGDSARARVVSIYDAINRIFEHDKNHNYLYNPSTGVSIILGITCYLALLLSIGVTLLKRYSLGLIFLSIFILTLFYLSFAKKTHPYFLFYSKVTEKYKKWNNWFVYNAIFIILINIIFFFLKSIFF